MSLETVTTLMLNAPPEALPLLGLAGVWLWNVAEDGKGAAYCVDGCLTLHYALAEYGIDSRVITTVRSEATPSSRRQASTNCSSSAEPFSRRQVSLERSFNEGLPVHVGTRLDQQVFDQLTVERYMPVSQTPGLPVAALAIGLVLIVAGMRRHLALRVDLRRARRQARERLAQLNEGRRARRAAGKHPDTAPQPDPASAPTAAGRHSGDRLVAGRRRPATS